MKKTMTLKLLFCFEFEAINEFLLNSDIIKQFTCHITGFRAIHSLKSYRLKLLKRLITSKSRPLFISFVGGGGAGFCVLIPLSDLDLQ